jgi:hypothetical protein
MAADIAAALPTYRHFRSTFALISAGLGWPSSCIHAGMTNDSVLVLRCRYCIVGTDFRALTAHKDGRFVCRDCGHTLRPGDPEYICVCRECIRTARERNKGMRLKFLP